MDSEVYKIQHPVLQPLVQYILFNKCSEVGTREISFSNTNFCLGIINDGVLTRNSYGQFTNESKCGLSSYISGMYLRPHVFISRAPLDEICIDFSPLGFRRFCRFEASDYILGQDVIKELWGSDGQYFFTRVFEEIDNQMRGEMIEKFLLKKLGAHKREFIEEVLSSIDHNNILRLADVRKAHKCSTRKLERHFRSTLDISPSQYLRVRRFRKLLSLNGSSNVNGLSHIAYSYGLCDQSHLVKEFQFFTGSSPTQLRKKLINIENTVFVAS